MSFLKVFIFLNSPHCLPLCFAELWQHSGVKKISHTACWVVIFAILWQRYVFSAPIVTRQDWPCYTSASYIFRIQMLCYKYVYDLLDSGVAFICRTRKILFMAWNFERAEHNGNTRFNLNHWIQQLLVKSKMLSIYRSYIDQDGCNRSQCVWRTYGFTCRIHWGCIWHGICMYVCVSSGKSRIYYVTSGVFWG